MGNAYFDMTEMFATTGLQPHRGDHYVYIHAETNYPFLLSHQSLSGVASRSTSLPISPAKVGQMGALPWQQAHHTFVGR